MSETNALNSAEKLCLELYKKGIVDFNKETGQYELAINKKIQMLEDKKIEIFGVARPDKTLMSIRMNEYNKLKEIDDEIAYLKKLFNL